MSSETSGKACCQNMRNELADQPVIEPPTEENPYTWSLNYPDGSFVRIMFCPWCGRPI